MFTMSSIDSVPQESWSNSSMQTGNTTIPTPVGAADVVYVEQKIADFIWTYFPPIVVTVGTIGNLLSFVVLLRSRMRSTSVYFYLMVLACADTMILYVSAFKTWIRVVTGFELLYASDASCKIIFFLSLVSFHLAAWIIVLITLDRFIVVWFPLKATTMCILSRARLATVSLVTIIVVYNVHVFWTFGLVPMRSGGRRCLPVDAYKSFTLLPFHILRLITYSFLPFVIILVLNVAIIVRLRRTPMDLHGQDTQHHGHTSAATAGPAQKDGSAKSRVGGTGPRPHLRLTYMLLTVSIAWLLLTAPWTIESLINSWDSKDPRTRARQVLAKTVCFMLYYANHSINFFLYCITGNKFYRELVDLYLHVTACTRRPWLVETASVKTIRSNCVELDAVPETYVARAVPSRSSRSDSRL